MTPKLTPLCTTFVESMNAFDSARFLTCFAPQAIVHDEGRTHQGHEEIRTWIEKAFTQYHPTLEITEVAEKNGDTVITGPVSGTFDGSPIVLHYNLTIEQDKIAELRIHP